MSTIVVAPSLLAASLGKISDELHSVETVGAKELHLDVMDGTFVPEITFGTNMVRTVKKIVPTMFLDTHLMIQRPEAHFQRFADAGSQRLTLHLEATAHLHRALQEIKLLKIESGVALNPATPVEQVFPVLELCDLVLIMTVNPGWGGQIFIPGSLAKIERLAAEIKKQKLTTRIQVDGGINEQTAPQVKAAGATMLVAGTAFFNSADRKATFQKLAQ